MAPVSMFRSLFKRSKRSGADLRRARRPATGQARAGDRAPRRPRPWPARSAARSRPGRASQKKPGASGAKPAVGVRSAVKVLRPAQRWAMRATCERRIMFEPVGGEGDVVIVGLGVAGIVRAPRRPARRAGGRPRAACRNRRRRCARTARPAMSHAGRRIDRDDRAALRAGGRAAPRPASAATRSAQAPAALTRTGAAKAPSTIQASPRRSIVSTRWPSADLAARRAHRPGEGLEQGVGVELEAGRVEQARAARRPVRTGQSAAISAASTGRIASVKLGHLRRRAPSSAGRVVLVGEIERGEGPRDRRLAEALRRRLEKGAAVGGERAHRRVADAVMAERDAAARAVIAERLLGLEHDHPAVRAPAAPPPRGRRCRRR